MKRFLLLVLLFLLAACGSATPATTETDEPAAVDDTAVSTEPDTPAVSSGDVEAVAAITPATTIAEAAEIRPQDHVKGATEPKVVILEYGDFQ